MRDVADDARIFLIAKPLDLIWGPCRCRSVPFFELGRAAFAFRDSGTPVIGVHILVGEDGMRQAALLRSDKGLGTPGTDRKKAKSVAMATAISPVIDDRKDHFVVRNGVRCAGVHLIVDLYEAEGSTISITSRGAAQARRRCGRNAAAHPPAPLRAEWWRVGCGGFGREPYLDPLLAGGNYAALDVFMCGDAKPDACIPVFRDGFQAQAPRGRRKPARAGRVSAKLLSCPGL